MMTLVQILGFPVLGILVILGLIKVHDILFPSTTVHKLKAQDSRKIKDIELEVKQMQKDVQMDKERAQQFLQFQIGILMDYACEFIYKKLNNLEDYEKAPQELKDEVDSQFLVWIDKRHPELNKTEE